MSDHGQAACRVHRLARYFYGAFDMWWMKQRLSEFGDRVAFSNDRGEYTYAALRQRIDDWSAALSERGLGAGHRVAVRGDCDPETCALLLAIAMNRGVVVPLSPSVNALHELTEIAGCHALFDFDGPKLLKVSALEPARDHPLYARLRADGAAGLVLFSSGSTGRSKASVLDFDRLLEKFQQPRTQLRALTFLLADHIGGINTMMHTLASGGTITCVSNRTPEAVCAAIQRHRVQLLPTTPTFLNMLLISEAYQRYDLTSLELITYGTEPMPLATLRHLCQEFPKVRLKQTYGLSELGILPTQSKDSSSVWLKVGGEGYETRIVDGLLWIRAQAAMLGYLNAPSPFDQDGWFNTGDAVEIDDSGKYLRILGRKSELINVGGEKVFPAEVEDVILQMPNVTDVVVTGRPNPLTGQVVFAQVTLNQREHQDALARRIRQACRQRLAAYKVPVAVEVVEGQLHSARFKKSRISKVEE